MNEGARLANDEIFKKELLAKLDRIIVLLEKQQAVEHSVHPTLLESRRKMVTCPNCQTVFGVELSAPQSG